MLVKRRFRTKFTAVQKEIDDAGLCGASEKEGVETRGGDYATVLSGDWHQA